MIKHPYTRRFLAKLQFSPKLLGRSMKAELATKQTSQKVASHSNPDDISVFARKYNLTPREQEITILIISGKSTAIMAEELFISPETVKKHVKNIMKKTETHSRYEIFTLFSRSAGNDR